jgi:hypothetical protein
MQHLGLKTLSHDLGQQFLTVVVCWLWHNDFTVTGDGHPIRSFFRSQSAALFP